MEDKFLIELLDSKYEESRGRFRDGKHSHEDLTIMMMKHQTNHIAHLEVDLNAKIEEQGRSLNAKIEEQGRSLNAKIEEQGRSLNAKIDALDTKIDKLEEKFDSKIDILEEKFDSSFKWLFGAIVSVGGVIVAVIALFR